MRCGGRAERGMTFVEAMVTMAVLAIGLAGSALAISHSARLTRRNLAQTQAQALAEQQLERIRGLGCDASASNNPCARVAALDGAPVPPVYWGASGEPTEVLAAGLRRYDLFIDVDPPFEGGETGSPGVRRALPVAGAAGNAVNVRVTVRWTEDEQPRFVALQTRMAP